MDAAPGTEAAAGCTEVAVGQTEAGVEGRASAVAVGGRRLAAAVAVARGVGEPRLCSFLLSLTVCAE